MTGKSISQSVNRAFRYFGGLFCFGGIYLGLLLFLTAPVEVSLTGMVESLTVNEIASQWEGEPPEINTVAVVSYRWEGEARRAEVGEWGEISWGVGDTLTLYLDPADPEYPSLHPLGMRKQQLTSALAAGFGLGLMGTVSLLLGLILPRGERRSALKDALVLVRMRSRGPLTEVRTSSSAIENVSRGNRFLGAILGGLGLILVAALTFSLPGQEVLFDQLQMVFPLILGVSFFFLGAAEFTSQRIDIKGGIVTVTKKGLWGRRQRKEPLSAFLGIGEITLERSQNRGGRRLFFREAVLLHPDPALSELSLGLFGEGRESDREFRQLSTRLGLPLILRDGELQVLEYSDGTILKEEPEDRGEDVSEGPAPSPREILAVPLSTRYLAILRDEPGNFRILRSYKGSLLWSAGLLLAGTGGTIAFGNASLLIPLGIMAVILGSFALRRDEFLVAENSVRIRSTFAGRPFSDAFLPLARIEGVRITPDHRRNNAWVLEISGGGKSLLFGHALKKEQLRWLQARLEVER